MHFIISYHWITRLVYWINICYWSRRSFSIFLKTTTAWRTNIDTNWCYLLVTNILQSISRSKAYMSTTNQCYIEYSKSWIPNSCHCSTCIAFASSQYLCISLCAKAQHLRFVEAKHLTLSHTKIRNKDNASCSIHR